MYAGYLEEGDRCQERGCKGKMFFPPVDNCSCHVSPPCTACTTNRLICNECGFAPVEPEYKDIWAAPGLASREYKPKPLDKTKISYRTKMHTHMSQIQEGVYPAGVTKEEVEAVVKGTFGGRFEYFANGRFMYIAYTD